MPNNRQRAVARLKKKTFLRRLRKAARSIPLKAAMSGFSPLRSLAMLEIEAQAVGVDLGLCMDKIESNVINEGLMLLPHEPGLPELIPVIDRAKVYPDALPGVIREALKVHDFVIVDEAYGTIYISSSDALKLDEPRGLIAGIENMKRSSGLTVEQWTRKVLGMEVKDNA